MENINKLNTWLNEKKLKLNDKVENYELDFSSICRLCLTEINTEEFNTSEFVYIGLILKFTEIFDYDEILICDLLEKIITEKVEENDKLPQNICSKCFQIAWNSYLFRYQCQQSNAALNDYLNIINNDTIDDQSHNDNEILVYSEDQEDNNLKDIKIIDQQDVNDNSLLNESVILQHENDSNQSYDKLIRNSKITTSQNVITELINETSITNDNSLYVENEIVFKMNTSNEMISNEKNKMSETDDAYDYDWCELEDGGTEHSNNLIKSELNDDTTTVDRNMITTITTDDNKNNYICTKCNLVFNSQSILMEHLKTTVHTSPTDNKQFRCDICDQSFTQLQTLKRHSKIHRAEEKNKLCTYCGKCFIRTDDLKRHIRIHTGERPYECTFCPKKYKQISELKEHQKTHSNEKNYVCNECGKALSSRNGLYIHMKIHRGEKKFECTLCGSKYVTSGELTSHTKHIHSKMRKFLCPIDDCSKTFVTKLSLNIHVSAHNGNKLYKCNICDKSLATPSSLLEHKRIHTGFKPKQCTICDLRLSNLQALKKHMRIHNDPTNEKLFKCDICPVIFHTGNSLKAHRKRYHRNNL